MTPAIGGQGWPPGIEARQGCRSSIPAGVVPLRTNLPNLPAGGGASRVFSGGACLSADRTAPALNHAK